MTNANNLTPTGPGWWYLINTYGITIVQVYDCCDGMVYFQVGIDSPTTVGDDTSEQWLGPVPMPGTFAPRELFDDMRRMLERIRPAMGTPADRVLARANEWNNANPIPDEATP